MLKNMQRRYGITASIMSLSALCFGISGCGRNVTSSDAALNDDTRLTPAAREQTKQDRLNQIRPLGNGVFLFPRSPYFPETVSDWREAHPNFHVTTVMEHRESAILVLVDWPPTATTKAQATLP